MCPRLACALWITEHSKVDLQCAGLWRIIERHCPLLYNSMLTDSPLMVIPSSTPLLLGSLTWNVPLLGTTDSNLDLQRKSQNISGRVQITDKISQ